MNQRKKKIAPKFSKEQKKQLRKKRQAIGKKVEKAGVLGLLAIEEKKKKNK